MTKKITFILSTYFIFSVQLVGAESFPSELIVTEGTFDLNEIFGTKCSQETCNEGLFNAWLCIDNSKTTIKYEPDRFYQTNKAKDLLDQFNTEELKALYRTKDGEEIYDPEVTAGIFRVNFRGLPLFVSYPYEDNTLLLFHVPDLNITESFKGKDRNESNKQLREYLRKNADEILKKLTEISPVDPIPATQFNQIRDEFDTGTSNSFNNPEAIDFGNSLQGIRGTGFRYEHHTTDGKDFTYLTLPLSKTLVFGGGRELTFRLPLEYRQVEEAITGQVAIGMSYKTPIINEKWFLTPSVSYGLVGSLDLIAAAQIISTSLTSNILLFSGAHSRYFISMANLIGYSKTLPIPIEFKGYKFSVERQNIITRNGILLSIPTRDKLSGKRLITDIFLIDTRAFGDPMYEDQYNEIGFSIRPQDFKKNKESTNFLGQRIGVGFKYFHSEVSSGWSFNVGYQF